MFSILLVIIYLSFISLGLPDALLGAAWPSMCPEFAVPLSYAGILSMIISAGTVISSLQSERLTKKLGTGLVTSLSVALTALALLGFSLSHSFWILCILALPYGLGAGSVDASLNNYVALHYGSHHMNWLHSMWGIGISVGPYLMSYALTNGMSWNMGYRFIFFLQVVLTGILFASLPLWKQKNTVKESSPQGTAVNETAAESTGRAMTLREIISIPGAKEVMVTFFFYCGVEQTAILWGSSYMAIGNGMSQEKAAAFAGMFCIGITAGRIASGFISMKIKDHNMVRMGQILILLGILMMILPGNGLTFAGLMVIGLGCAPIYPSLIHSTPDHFGADKSQAVIGVQMASAYVGTTLLSPLFGVIAQTVDIRLLPFYLAAILLVTVGTHESMLRKSSGKST